MKSFAVIAAAALATVVSAAQCELAALAPDFISLVPQANACATATGFPIIPPQTNPTAQQVTDICSKCTDLIAAASAKTFPSCTFEIDGVATPLNTFFNKVVGGCGSTSARSSSAAGSSATSATVETPAPAASTSSGSSAPATSTSSGSSASPSTVSTPAPTTAAPSSAMTASVSVAAVVVGSITVFIL
uniref:Elicitin n=1 Tax=Globisporangium ultimum (strain ATCC 200006 / CBS 805.95 / DAOM BR144) TaxID=431595 RepID=K3X5K3_GLOUD